MIAQLDDAELEAQLNLQQSQETAQGQINQADAAVAAAQAQLAQAQAQAQQTAAERKLAQVDRDRYSSLLQEGVISQQLPEGEAREMTRQFLDVDGVEVEVCNNENGKHFVRHNVYWWIVYGQKTPDTEGHWLIEELQNAVDNLPTIRWSGYRFRFETIVFSEDDVEVESILLPLAMFENLMRDEVKSNLSKTNSKW